MTHTNQFVEDLKAFVDEKIKIVRQHGDPIIGICHSIGYTSKDFIVGVGDEMVLVRDAVKVSVFDGDGVDDEYEDDEEEDEDGR